MASGGMLVVCELISGYSLNTMNTPAQPEQERGRQTDAAVDIERQVAVIPPIGMKPFFQHPRGQIFHDGAADHGNEKYLPDL